MKIRATLSNPRLWPWLLIVPGVILRFWNLGSCSPLWYDESFTAIVAQLPLTRLISAVAGDVHPPLYYLVSWLSARIYGVDPFFLRFPAAVFSVMGLLAFYEFLDLLPISRRARLIALGIFAFFPSNIYYAQEARMYSLLQWLVILQLIYLLQNRWGMLFVAVSLTLYTHNYGLFYTGVVFVFGFLQELKRPREIYRAGIDGEFTQGMKIIFISFAGAFILWIPWMIFLLKQMGIIHGNYWIQPTTLGSVLLETFYIMAGTAPDKLLPINALCVFTGFLLLVFAALKKPRRLGLVILSFGPLALAVLASVIYQPLLLYRGLIGMVAPLAALAGDMIDRSKILGKIVGAALLMPYVVCLVWLIGASEVGIAKNTRPYPTYRADLPVIHLDDWTLVTALNLKNDYLLDSGCTDEAGDLSEPTIEAMGIRKISIDNLPKEFIFAARLFPLSTACYERVYYTMTQNAAPISVDKADLRLIGVWYVKK